MTGGVRLVVKHDRVVDMWGRYYAARDRAEQAGDHS